MIGHSVTNMQLRCSSTMATRQLVTCLDTRLQKRPLSLTLAALLVVLISGCDWVDSTGIQTGDPVGNPVALIEETQTNLEFSVPVSDPDAESEVRSWVAVDEGRLAACGQLINLTVAASSLEEACSPQEPECEVIIVENSDGGSEEDANGVNQYQHQFAVFPPALSIPVGVRYRWEFLDDAGNTVTEDVDLCIDAVNQPPEAGADRYVVFEDSDLQIEGAEFGDDCSLQGQNNLLANDADDHHLNAGCLIAELVEPPRYASNDVTETFTETGGFIYIAEDDREHPLDRFTYRVFDGEFYSEETTVEVLVASEWTEPDAQADVFIVNRNSSDNELLPLSNDDDPEDTPMMIIAVSKPTAGGTVTIEDDDVLLYSPLAGFRGNDYFRYTIENEYGQFDDTLIRVRVR